MAELKLKTQTESWNENSQEEIPQDTQSSVESIDTKPKIKLNLTALKSWFPHTDSDKKEEIEETNQDQRQISSPDNWQPDMQNISENIKDTWQDPQTEIQEVLEDVIPVEDFPQEAIPAKKSKINLTNIKSNTATAANSNTSPEDDQEASDQEMLPDIEKKVEAQEKMFGNYQSHFEKKSQNFMDRLRNLKTTPKTRLGLVLFLILMTVGTIGSLMYFVPEKHSFKIYTASIMEIYNSQIKKTSTKTPNRPAIPVENPIQETLPPPVDPVEEKQPRTEEEKQEKVKNFLLENYWK